jgi:methionyl-tRNA formyltransferase
MNIVFFGSGGFALKSLEALVTGIHKVNLVVTQPDKPKGRHLALSSTEVKSKAEALGLKIIQPQNPNSLEAITALKEIPADLYVVISYGHFLKEPLLRLPKLYPLNVHASLLPKYRGAAPINWAIINGEKETGVSIIRMAEAMDAGDILLENKIPIDDKDTAISLEEKLGTLAADALTQAIRLIEKKSEKFKKQDTSAVSFAPKLEKRHGEINWNESAAEISRQIKGLIPWPGAYTHYKGKLLKFWRAQAREENSKNPGEILEAGAGRLIIGTARGSLEIVELQLEGGRRLSASAFLSGHRITASENIG